MLTPHYLARAAALAEQFRNATPYPHVVLDDALDSDSLSAAVAEWPAPDAECWRQFQRGKRAATNIDAIPPKLAAVLRYGLSTEFVGWLERLTGIDGLIGDPTFGGAGLHEVERDGALPRHVDFNRAGELYRRLNCMLYLGTGWQSKWGGALELSGSPDATEVVHIPPTFNRLVIFESGDRSWHSHGKVSCPPDRSRRAIALYYYTSGPPPWFHKSHSTLYANRKATRKLLGK